MAEKKKVSTTTTPKKANNSDGFVPVSKTITTTYQNSKGVTRKITETTTAPKAKKQTQAKKPAQAKPSTVKKPTAKKGGSKK